jgi:hypothetical protein
VFGITRCCRQTSARKRDAAAEQHPVRLINLGFLDPITFLGYGRRLPSFASMKAWKNPEICSSDRPAESSGAVSRNRTSH